AGGAVLGVDLLELGIECAQLVHAARDLDRIGAGGAGVLGLAVVSVVVAVLVLAVLVILAVGLGVLVLVGSGGRRRCGLFVVEAVVEADHDLGQALLARLVQ